MINRRRDIFTCIRYKSSRRFRKWVFIAHNLIWETLTLLKGAWIGFYENTSHFLISLISANARSVCFACVCWLRVPPPARKRRGVILSRKCARLCFFSRWDCRLHTRIKRWYLLTFPDVCWCGHFKKRSPRCDCWGTEPVCVFQITLLHCLKQSNRLDGGTLELQMWLFESRSRIKLKW